MMVALLMLMAAVKVQELASQLYQDVYRFF